MVAQGVSHAGGHYNARVTRSSASFRRMAWLALAAVVLSLAMPTASRVLAAVAPGTAPVLMEMCTAAGTKLVDVSPFLGDETPAPPMPAMTEACDYCVLVPPLTLALALLFLLLLHLPQSPLRRRYVFFPNPLRNLRGLGSQAPPIAL